MNSISTGGKIHADERVRNAGAVVVGCHDDAEVTAIATGRAARQQQQVSVDRGRAHANRQRAGGGQGNLVFVDEAEVTATPVGKSLVGGAVGLRQGSGYDRGRCDGFDESAGRSCLQGTVVAAVARAGADQGENGGERDEGQELGVHSRVGLSLD